MELCLVNGPLGSEPGRVVRKQRRGERPRASGKRALFTLLERIWSSVCLKEMPLGKQCLAHVCAGECLMAADPDTADSESGPGGAVTQTQGCPRHTGV